MELSLSFLKHDRFGKWCHLNYLGRINPFSEITYFLCRLHLPLMYIGRQYIEQDKLNEALKKLLQIHHGVLRLVKAHQCLESSICNLGHVCPKTKMELPSKNTNGFQKNDTSVLIQSLKTLLFKALTGRKTQLDLIYEQVQATDIDIH
ncbi:hypothetical protein K501DRAFT_330982 [Backusella circina FSU 941]|nr:hypothetical protein K501DRAFT_330982 [Backusella circina FSU 941]